jgi:nitroreductase
MDVMEAMKKRRSIRRFAADDVPDAIIAQVLEAARLAPSTGNSQPWRFMVIRDKEHLKELSRICRNQPFIQRAPVVIGCFGDLNRYSPEVRKQTYRALVEVDALADEALAIERKKGLANITRSAMSNEDALVSIRANTYIAVEHLILMATALGLVTCWVGSSNLPEINRLLSLPDNLIPVALIPVGYPVGELSPQRPRLSLDEIMLKPLSK